jgi:hypothetical protein
MGHGHRRGIIQVHPAFLGKAALILRKKCSISRNPYPLATGEGFVHWLQRLSDPGPLADPDPLVDYGPLKPLRPATLPHTTS